MLCHFNPDGLNLTEKFGFNEAPMLLQIEKPTADWNNYVQCLIDNCPKSVYSQGQCSQEVMLTTCN